MKKQIVHTLTLILLLAIGLNAVQAIYSPAKSIKSDTSLILEEIENIETQNSKPTFHTLKVDLGVVYSKNDLGFIRTKGASSKLILSELIRYVQTPRYIFYHNLKLYC